VFVGTRVRVRRIGYARSNSGDTGRKQFSMPRRIHLAPHLTDNELQKRYRAEADPVERSHWHFLWLLAGSMPATAVAGIAGYSAYWIGQVAACACSRRAVPSTRLARSPNGQGLRQSVPVAEL
jgi:hypothetical protein